MLAGKPSKARGKRIAVYELDAEDLAAANGHELGDWYQAESLLTAARCNFCGASAGLLNDESPLPASSIDKPCRKRPDRPRFSAQKCGRMTYVHDRERPMYVIDGGKAAPMKALAKRLNGDTAEALPERRVALRAKLARAEATVERLQAQLAELDA